MPKARFMMVDGLDGSGKGSIMQAMREHCMSKGLGILDLKEFCLEHYDFPSVDMINASDVILSIEPSYSYIGRAIRNELIRGKSNSYSGISIAQAFSLDREVLYNRVIIPAVRAGKIIIQDRGIVTSVVYQPVQDRIPLSEILRLPGNHLSLRNAPQLLLLTLVSADTALARISQRKEKSENIFENLFFQRKIEERYNSQWLKSLFERFGTEVQYLNTNSPKSVGEVQEEAVKIWEKFVGATG